MPLDEMADLVENFYSRAGLINLNKAQGPWQEVEKEELLFIDNWLDNRIINALLANSGYSPQMGILFPGQLFRAELLKAITYPKISYRTYGTKEYMGQECKEKGRFLCLPLNKVIFVVGCNSPN
ncbi:MAG: hypothetical protein CSA33_01755 [Desulfobulbus propionicus]|nr:MAG: hypothetical protein CSA33_01755 [Desulfobulbus propionicus]